MRTEPKKAKQIELASYLGVTKGAVSQYDKKKLELMLFGLPIKKDLEAKASKTQTVVPAAG